MFSFIALSSRCDQGMQEEETDMLARQLEHDVRPWQQVYRAKGLRVFCRGIRAGSNDVVPLHGEGRGLVLGALFQRNADPLDEGPSPLARLDEERSKRIIYTRGRDLIESYWGRYVAFLRDPATRTQWIIRDPTGNLPCYRTCYGGISIFYSGLPDLKCLPLGQWRIDESALRTRLAMGMVHAGSTLENAEEIFNGECLELYGTDRQRQFYWNPLRIARNDVIEDPDLALRLLRSAVVSAVHSWAQLHSSIVVLASGGLDSSIVAATLKEAANRPRLSCFTVHIPQDANNTLPFSRAIAEHLGVQPVEFPYDPTVEWSALLGFPIAPHPTGDLGILGMARAQSSLASQTGATAIFTGDGGDSRFGATAARYSAREYVRHHGLRPGLLKVAEHVALLRGLLIWRVLGDALRTRWKGEPSEHEAAIRERVLINRAVVENLCAQKDYAPHPWYSEVPSSLRSSSTYARLGTLSQLPTLYNLCADSGDAAPEYTLPLYAQPLVEISLRTVTWVHIVDGGDRVLARRAFAGRVPQKILDRQWKDRPNGVLEGMLSRNLTWARELLHDGVLAKLGLLEPQAIERHLNPKTLRSAMFGGELLDCVLVEGWGRRVLASQPAG